MSGNSNNNNKKNGSSNNNSKKNGSKNASSSLLNNDRKARNDRRSRTQYHYVYGSIPDSKNNDSDEDMSLTVPDDRSTDAAPTSDQDSLIGESLIPTDDESGLGGSTLGSESDFTHLLMTNGNRTTSLQRLTLLPNGGGKPPMNAGKRRSGSGKIASPKRPRRWYSNLHPLSLRHSHPIIFGILIIVTGLLVTGLLAVLFFPDSAVAQAASRAATGQDLPYPMPWPRMHRASYADPVEGFISLDLMDPALVKNDGKSTFAFPFPTGAFWTNFMLKDSNSSSTSGHQKGLSYPVVVYPYAYKWSDQELQLSYPRQHRYATTTELRDDFIPDLRLTSVQPVNRRYIRAFDPLSVTLRYEMDNKGSMTAFLVQGSPYWTVQFSGVAPVLTTLTTFSAVTCPKDADLAALGVVDEDGSGRRTRRRLSYGVCTQNDKSSSRSSSSSTITTLQGVQFILQSQEGLVWYVFASEPLTWAFDRTTRRSLTATEPFTGVLRVALVPTNTLPPTGSTSSSSSSSSQMLDSADSYLKSTGLARLIYHAGVYPTSGSVSWSFISTSSGGSGGGGNAASLAVHFASKTVNGLAAAVTGGTVIGGNYTSSNSSSSGHGSNATTPTSTGSSSFSTATSDSTALPVDRVATLTFKFETQSFTQSSSATPQKKLLMLALPHHARSLSPSSLLNKNSFDLVFECIKGALRPVLGSTWSYNVALPTYGVDGDRGATDDLRTVLQNPTIRTTLLANLDQDVRLALPSYNENIYGFGKQVARLAQLLHVATKLQNAMSDNNNSNNSTSTNSTSSQSSDGWGKSQAVSLASIVKEAQSHLNVSLQLLFSRNVSDYLVFDEDLGGLVSLDGLNDSLADFGNGRYNDHHFHYGYILYACAILAGVDPEFVENHGKTVDAIMYDVAYQGNFASSRQRTNGPFFPGARHKSWFDGHSFASGLFPAANGKSQESSSEAVNCYYGVYLWSLARNGYLSSPADDTSPDTDFARLLLATEILGAKTYWQMLPPDNTSASSMSSSSGNKTIATSSSISNSPQLPQQGVYPSQFAQNYMVGNIGMLDAVCRTWFGKELVYVHMINFLPVTTATGELFTRAYAGREYQTVLKSLEANTAWIGYVIANQAIGDPNAAWTQASGVSSPKLDPGLSKTQLLYWIATRKGFSLGNASTTTSVSRLPVPSSGSHSSSVTSPAASPSSAASSTESCSSNVKCAALGLIGKCCPTPSGVFLECCLR